MEVSPSDAIATFTIDVAAARPTTWEFLTMPGHRAIWTAGSTGVEENAVNGRRGPGTITHCMHGKDVIVEEFIDWRPHDYITRRAQIFDTGLVMTMTHALSDGRDGGTRIDIRVAKPAAEDMEEIHRADAAAGAIDARLGRNVGEAVGRSCRSATRRGGRRAGGAGFRRPLCQAAGKPLNDPPAAQIARSVDTAAPLEAASLLATFFGPSKLTFLQENPICVPRKSGTRELGTDEKLALPRELLPVLGFSKVSAGRDAAFAERQEGLARRRRELRLQVK